MFVSSLTLHREVEQGWQGHQAVCRQSFCHLKYLFNSLNRIYTESLNIQEILKTDLVVPHCSLTSVVPCVSVTHVIVCH